MSCYIRKKKGNRQTQGIINKKFGITIEGSGTSSEGDGGNLGTSSEGDL